MFSDKVIMTRSLTKGFYEHGRAFGYTKDILVNGKWKTIPDAEAAANERYLDWQVYLLQMKEARVRRAAFRAWCYTLIQRRRPPRQPPSRQETFKRGGSNYECDCSDSECDADWCDS
jgi:hypothetical protein